MMMVLMIAMVIMISCLFVADNQWTLHKLVRTLYDMYYPDERGDFPLKTTEVLQSNYSGPDAGLVSKYDAHFYLGDSRMDGDHCYINPSKCQDGISIGFWFKGLTFGLLYQTYLFMV